MVHKLILVIARFINGGLFMVQCYDARLVLFCLNNWFGLDGFGYVRTCVITPRTATKQITVSTNGLMNFCFVAATVICSICHS